MKKMDVFHENILKLLKPKKEEVKNHDDR